MTFDQLMGVYNSLPDNLKGPLNEGENDGDRFNHWAGNIGAALGINDGTWESIPDDVGAVSLAARHPDLLGLFKAAQVKTPGITAAHFAIQYGNDHPEDTRFDDPTLQKDLGIMANTQDTQPAEQGFGNYATNLANQQILDDARRKQEAAALLAGYQPLLNSSRNTLASLSTSTDAAGYFSQVQGLKEYYDREHANPTGQWPNIENETPEQFAEEHFKLFGAKYNLTAPKQSTALLRSELGASADAQAAQQTALNTQVTGLNGNLATQLTAQKAAIDTQLTQLSQGIGAHTDAERAALTQELQARKGALDTQLSQLGTGIDTHTAAATAALNTQLGALKDSLSGELATKAANLQQQVATLTAGLGKYTAEERAALTQQVADQFKSLGAEVETKRGAITQQLATMGQGITDQDTSRRTALQSELDGLNAAQAPLNAARVAGAQTLAASVNLGAQSEQDRLRAQAGRSGYVGDSSGDNMAIARAVVGGRQQAAQALADANTANATDTSGIAKYGATKGYGIADVTAGQRQQLTNSGATDNRNLTDYSAGQTRGVSDFSSAGERAIADTAAKGTLDINSLNANDTRTLGDYGATQGRGISDFGANTGAVIANQNADQKLQLNAFGAGENRTLSDYGSSNNRAISSTDADQKLQLNTLGAGENRTLSDFGSNQQRAIGDLSVNDTRNISDSAASRNLSFFSNDVQRRLASLNLPAAALNSEFAIRQAADDYGNSGFVRGMNALNYFRTNSTGAPQAQAYTGNQPVDSGLGNVAAGLLSVAGGIGKANNWWSGPSSTAGIGAPTSYSNFIATNPNSSAAGETTPAYTPVDTTVDFSAAPVTKIQ